MTIRAACCETLAWDSEFFGLHVARVRAVEPADLVAADELCRADGVQVAYLQLGVEDVVGVRAAEEVGFRYVDVRIVFELAGPASAGSLDGAPGTTVRRHEGPSTTTLERIAASSHHDSRFYADGRFDEARCDELYATWIRRSCADPLSVVLVAERDGDVAGYLSYRADDDAGVAVIDLVAVAAAHRGAGVGRALVHTGIHEALQSSPRVEVATQGRNLAAQRLYQRAGMTTSSLAVWFHKWYE